MASCSSSAKPSISTQILESVRDKLCSICLCRIHYRKAAVLKMCMHAYCVDCIRKWSDFKRNCPLCNAHFDRWFFNLSLSTGNFKEERLLDLNGKKELQNGSITNQARPRLVRHIYRDHLHTVAQRSRQLPWRRSFGQSRFIPSPEARRHQAEIIAQRVLQWRASVYKRRLQAVPLHISSRDYLHQSMVMNNDAKERIQQRVEPWIKRELQAILGDSDPSVIIHLATSLWILSVEEKLKHPSRSSCEEDKFIRQLKPFLLEQAEMFWHELRCFAESSFTMETYDSVVEYRQID